MIVRPHRLPAAVAAVFACVVAACSGNHGSTPVAPVVPASATPASGAAASASVPYGATLLRGASFLGRATLKDMGVDVYATMRDAAGLQRYARDASDPHATVYRHWLTPAQIGDRFGAPASDYTALVAALNAGHLAVKTYPQRQMVRVRGAQADLEKALGTTFGFYRAGTRTFLAPTTAPHPPAELKIAGLGNAISYTRRRRNFVTVRVGAGLIQGYSPQQIANAFDYTGAYGKGYRGDGIAIGIIGTGAITDGDPRISVGDVTDFKKLFSLGGTGSVVQIVDTASVSPGNGQPGGSYSQGLASPPPVTSPSSSGCAAQGYSPSNPTATITDYTTCNPEDTEAQLDTEQAAALAPNATINFYIAYNPMECFGTCGASGSASPSPQLGLALSDDEIQQAIADNKSDVISMSFGSDEQDSYGLYYGYAGTSATDPGFGPAEIASLLAEGIAVFVSSGDSGAEGCSGSTSGAVQPDNPCVAYPATDPSAVSVGGVNAPLDDSGRLVGPLSGWGEQTQTASGTPGGSGGGCSIYFQAPTYETSLASALCAGNRTQPDLSLDADTATGVAVVTNAAPELGGRTLGSVGGTSVAAPEAAAMWGLVVQACKQSSVCSGAGSGSTPYRLGNPNPLIFQVNANAQAYAATFADVQYGNNSLPSSGGTGRDPGFTSGVGYDLVTGWGVPYARNLIQAIVGV